MLYTYHARKFFLFLFFFFSKQIQHMYNNTQFLLSFLLFSQLFNYDNNLLNIVFLKAR